MPRSVAASRPRNLHALRRLAPWALLFALGLGLAAGSTLDAAARAHRHRAKHGTASARAGKAPRARATAKAKPPAPPAPARVTVTILHTTDLHGHLLGWDYETGRRADGYGLAKVATLIHRVRSEPDVHALLVDAGDCIQGSALEDRHGEAVARATGTPPGADSAGAGADSARAAARAALEPDPQILCMNALGYDAMAVGNHEYSFGLPVLERARQEAQFPWLSANTVKLSPAGAGAYQAYVVKEVEGVRIGILGLTTPAVPTWEDSSHFAGLQFDDPVETARHFVPILRGMERCDAVILLAHTGLEEDDRGRPVPGQAPHENLGLALARGVPGVDAIVLGHTHAKVESRMEHGVLLTQAGRWGDCLGRLDLTFEKNATGPGYRLADRKAALLPVDASVPEDPTIVALVKPAHDATEAELAAAVGSTTRPLSAADARAKDNALLDLVQRTELDFGRADVSFAAQFNPRQLIPAGPITRRDVMTLYPYPNTLVVVDATGQDVKDALEHAASAYNTYDFGRGQRPVVNPQTPGYDIDAAEGVSYTLDATRPVGRRIRDLAWRGKPLDPARHLRVAINNVRLAGGGGYDTWKGKPVLWKSDRPIRDLVVDELARLGPLDGVASGNWRAVPAWGLVEGGPRVGLELLVRRGVIPPDSALAYGPDAPLTRRRYGAWLAAAGGDSARALVDPSAPRAPKRAKGAPRITPADPVNRPLALAAARTALPEPARSRLTGAQAGAWDAPGPGLTVGEGAAVLASVFFPRLTVLETTDFHGALLTGAKDRASGRPVGGAGALAGLVERERAKDPAHTIVLDGGDWMQGTPVSNLNFGRPVIEFMNREGVEVSAVGNHEFDWSADTLFARMRQARFQPLAANWYDRSTHARTAGVAPWTIVDKGGMRIGVIGLMTVETPTTTKPDNVRPYEFPPGGPIARALEDSLRAAGADLVVVVGHLPASVDSSGAVKGELAEVARAVGAAANPAGGAIAVFGGHSHNRVSGVVNGTPVMISGALGTTLGRMDFVVDRRTGRPIDEETRRQLLTPFGDDPQTVDPAFTAFADSVNRDLAPVMARVLGKSTADLVRNRQGESSLGDWVADAMRVASGADFAFQNPGGLRADLAAGDVTVGEVYEVMPFDNTIETVTLTGAQVLDVLEHGVSPTTCLQLSGLRLTYDPERPRGERVIEALLPSGKRLDMAARYKVAMNDFMAQGGDGFTTFAQGPDLTNTGVLVRDAMQKSLESLAATGRPLTPPAPGRIVNLAATRKSAGATEASPASR